jgi:hypothetical protein
MVMFGSIIAIVMVIKEILVNMDAQEAHV